MINDIFQSQIVPRKEAKEHRISLKKNHQLLKRSISNQHVIDVFFTLTKLEETSSQGNGCPDSIGNRKTWPKSWGLMMVYGRYNELVFMGVIMVYKPQLITINHKIR